MAQEIDECNLVGTEDEQGFNNPSFENPEEKGSTHGWMEDTNFLIL